MKVKFGLIVTDGRGKLGGHVMSKNRAGNYVRTKVTPSNPNTSFQSSVRSILTQFSQAWRGLTQAQRDSWNGAVDSYQGSDIFGDIKSPSGINLYIKLNSNLAEVSASSIALPPLPESVAAVTLGTSTAAAGTPAFSLVFGTSPVPASTVFIVRATAQVSPGKKFVKNLYRNVAFLAAAETTPYDLLAEYVARFGSLVAGQKIGIELVAVNTTTGQKGTAINTSLIVGAQFLVF